MKGETRSRKIKKTTLSQAVAFFEDVMQRIKSNHGKLTTGFRLEVESKHKQPWNILKIARNMGYIDNEVRGIWTINKEIGEQEALKIIAVKNDIVRKRYKLSDVKRIIKKKPKKTNMKKTDNQDKILKHLKGKKIKKITNEVAAKVLDKEYKTGANLLSNMCKKGLLDREGRVIYTLSAKGEAYEWIDNHNDRLEGKEKPNRARPKKRVKEFAKFPKKAKVKGSKASQVDHPSHYNTGKIEVIDYIEDQELNFNLGNVVKYVSRAGKKNPDAIQQDLEKALWYLNREIENFNKK